MDETWQERHNREAKPFATTTIGSTELQLIHEYDAGGNLREKAIYPDGSKEDFDGHRVPMKVVLEQYNYLKESELSGDEIRKGGTCRIFAEGEQIDEFFFREMEHGLMRARDRMMKIWDSSCSWWSKAERAKLPGRKVYYRDFPAIVDRLVEDQGCLILKPDGATEFPPTATDIEARHDNSGVPENDNRTYAKVEFWDEHIWWWRKAPNTSAR